MWRKLARRWSVCCTSQRPDHLPCVFYPNWALSIPVLGTCRVISHVLLFVCTSRLSRVCTSHVSVSASVLMSHVSFIRVVTSHALLACWILSHPTLYMLECSWVLCCVQLLTLLPRAQPRRLSRKNAMVNHSSTFATLNWLTPLNSISRMLAISHIPSFDSLLYHFLLSHFKTRSYIFVWNLPVFRLSHPLLKVRLSKFVSDIFLFAWPIFSSYLTQ